jgi:hypothetical protein
MKKEQLKKLMKNSGFIFSNSEYKGTVYYVAHYTEATFEAFTTAIEQAIVGDAEPVLVMALKISQLIARVVELEDLLTSAYVIANREGIETHWRRFLDRLYLAGIRGVTAKTFKILPSDDDYLAPPQLSTVEAERDRYKVALTEITYSHDGYARNCAEKALDKDK